jgi:glycosyltransferase involved in cell wall biosynthesis
MDKKLKVLLLSDHPLSTSGVGTQARWLTTGLVNTGRYSFRCFGGAVRHESYETITVNPDFIIKPIDGFGNKQTLRQALAVERPDILLLFTDPRFFIWAWEMEDEIHQICPIAYWHLWDNPPWPEFNRVLYDSTDLINCINWPTYEMVSERFPDRTNYIPHAVPSDIYFPLKADEIKKYRTQLLGKEREEHFIALYVSRNARRKVPSDILISWKEFITQLKEKHGHTNATLLMHTDPLDPEGPHLHSVVELLGIREHVFFSNDRCGFGEMNVIYNICDTVINRSVNEGFGLSLLEAKMTGKPVIALKTGGMTRQVVDHETGYEYGIALQPEVRTLVGNQMIPYIYEDFVSHETVTKAFMDMYEMGPEKRAEIGMHAIEHAKRDYDVNNMIKSWDESLVKLHESWSQSKRKSWTHTVI